MDSVYYDKYVKYKTKYLQAQDKLNTEGGWLKYGYFIIFYNSMEHENFLESIKTNLQQNLTNFFLTAVFI